MHIVLTLRKLAYSNILNISPPKTESFQIKNSDIFHIFSQNIDCGYSLEPPRRGGSNEYPQSMLFSKIIKIMYTPVNPSFTISKWGLRGSKLYRRVFVMRKQFARSVNAYFLEKKIRKHISKCHLLNFFPKC